MPVTAAPDTSPESLPAPHHGWGNTIEVAERVDDGVGGEKG